MNIYLRNNIQIIGKGPIVMLFSHGFGCDQNMWRYITPAFLESYTVVLFDLVGSGKSDLSAYDFEKYSTLHKYAEDIIEIIDAVSDKPVIFVGHSVSTVIGLLASIKAPEKFQCQIMISPSPCYINVDDYIGGFSRADVEELCDTIDSNYLGWSSSMAPTIMGAPDQPELAVELTNSFCRTDPKISKHFARVTFLSDHRDALSQTTTPTLILQCNEDFIAPCTVGEYMKKTMSKAKMCIIDNVGHCPHLSSPNASIKAIQNYLKNNQNL